jgi:hypothetical protein
MVVEVASAGEAGSAVAALARMVMGRAIAPSSAKRF